ncbi:MAG: hypothetical protein WBP51_02820 [Candidatus Sulfotelmatobacter sp.]
MRIRAIWADMALAAAKAPLPSISRSANLFIETPEMFMNVGKQTRCSLKPLEMQELAELAGIEPQL